jgi:hypothetical protein
MSFPGEKSHDYVNRIYFSKNFLAKRAGKVEQILNCMIYIFGNLNTYTRRNSLLKTHLVILPLTLVCKSTISSINCFASKARQEPSRKND